MKSFHVVREFLLFLISVAFIAIFDDNSDVSVLTIFFFVSKIKNIVVYYNIFHREKYFSFYHDRIYFLSHESVKSFV